MALISTNMMIRVLADISDASGKMATLSAQVKGMSSSFNGMVAASNNAVTKAGTMAVGFGTAMQTVGAGMTKYVTLPLGIIGGLAMKASVDFETAFAGVRKTIDEGVDPITGAITEFAVLSKGVIDISNKLGVAKADVAKAMELAGQLGIRGNGALIAFTDTVSKLNITTGLSTEYLSLMIGRLVNIGGLDVEKDIANLGSVITDLGNRTATTEKDLLRFGVRLMAAGRIVGMTIPEVLGLAAAAEATGTKAERGGTAFTKILLAMKAEATSGAGAVGEMTVAMNKNSKELEKWQGILENAIETQKSFNENTPDEEVKRVTALIATAQENVETYTDAMDNLNYVTTMQNNTQGGFAKLLGMTSGAYKELMLSSGGATKIMIAFATKLGELGAAGVDVQGVLKDLGLSDARLIQAVLSLAQAEQGLGDGLGKTSSAYSNAVKIATDAMKDAQAGLGNAMEEETNKRLDTTAKQLNIFKELVTTIAIIFGGPVNEKFKEFMKGVNDSLGSLVKYLEGLPPEAIDKMVDKFLTLLALGPGLTAFGLIVATVGKSFQGLGGLMTMAATALTGKSAGSGIAKAGALGNTVSIMNVATMYVGNMIGGAGGKVAKAVGDAGQSVLAFNPDWKPNPDADTFTGQGSMFLPANPYGTNNAQGNMKAHYDPAERSLNTRGRDSRGRFLPEAGAGAVGRIFADPSIVDPTLGLKDSVGVAQGLGEAPKTLGFFDIIKNKILALQVAWDMFKTNLGATATGKALLGLIATFKFISVILLGGVAIVAALALGFTLFFVSTGQGMQGVYDLFSKFSLFLDGLLLKVQDALNILKDGTALEEFAKKFGKVFTYVLEWFVKLAPKIGELIGAGAVILLKVGMDLLGYLITGFVGNLPLMIATVIGFLKGLLQTIADNLPMILEAGANLIFTLAKGFGKAIPSLLKGVWDLFWMIIGVILSINWLEVAGWIFVAIVNIVWGLIEGLIEGLVMIWDSFWAWIGKVFNGFIDWVKKLFGISSPSTLFAKFGKWIIEGLWNGIKEMWEKLKSWFKIAVDFGKEFFADPLGTLKNIGKNIVEGLWNGLKDKWGDVTGWFKKKIAELPQWIKDFLNIKSPSQVFRYIGQMTTEGLALGLEDGTKRIDRAKAGVEDAVMINPDGTTSSFGMGGGMDDFIQSMVTAMKQAGLGTMNIDGKEVTKALSPSMAMSVKRDKQW